MGGAIASALIAVLTGMGVGGGSLFVIYLTFFRGTPQLEAQALNLAFFLVASLASIPVHLKKRTIHTRLLVVLVLTGVLGSLASRAVAPFVDAAGARKLFGVLLLVSAAYVLWGEGASFWRRRKKGNGKN